MMFTTELCKIKYCLNSAITFGNGLEMNFYVFGFML